MELEAAKMIGAGLAMIGLVGVGIGIGNIYSSLLNAIARNPSAEDTLKKTAIIGFAFTEAVAFLALIVAFLILNK